MRTDCVRFANAEQRSQFSSLKSQVARSAVDQQLGCF
jgi:hypothetical protein